MKHIFSRSLILFASTLVSLFIATQSAWGADAVSATHTIEGQTHTWTNISATVTKNKALGGNGLYFVAGSSGNISTSGGIVNIKEGRIMYVQVPSATSTGQITIFAASANSDRCVKLNSTAQIYMVKDDGKGGGGSSANFVAGDIEYINDGYYIKLVSASDYKFNKIVVVLDAVTSSTTYYISVFNSDKDGKTNFSESATNAGEYVIENFVVPAAKGDGPQCWVGENNAWSDSYSANWYLSDIPLTANNSNKLGSAAGAIGTLHIWPASSAKNKDLQFSPDSYGMSWGTNGGSWSFVPFSQVEGYKWQTDLVTISTTARDSWQYWVGFSASPSGYVFSTTKSSTLNLSAIGIVTSSGSISGTVSDLTADTKGKFEIYDNSTDKNWYVHFIPYYHVAYDEAGGSEVADGEYVAVNAGEQTITLPTTPTKAGYRLDSWSDGSTTYQPGEPYVFTPNADVTFTARWTPAYNVTYVLGEGATGTVPTEKPMPYLETFALAQEVGFSKEGYKLAGWEDNFGTQYLFRKGTFSYTMWREEDVTLTAIWEAVEGTYTVTFNYNDEGATASNSETGCSEAPVTLPSPTRTGYTFKGWYDAATGGILIGTAGASYPPTKDITLYAQWEKIVEPACTTDVYYNTVPDGKTQSTRFTFSSKPSGTNTLANTMTIDGVDYTCANRSSSTTSTFSFTIPDGKEATLYMCVCGGGSSRVMQAVCGTEKRSVSISNTKESNDTYKTFTLSNLTAGTWEVTCIEADGETDAKSWYLAMLGLQECKTCNSAGLSFPQVEYTVALGSSFTAPTLTQTTMATATYESSNTAVATVDANTGAITPVGEGTTTITASTPADGDYCAGEASYLLTVTLPACQTPTINTQPATATYCAREAITALSVAASVNDGGTLSYQWQKGGADISGATNATYTPTGAGTYTCVVTNTLADHTPASITSSEAVITINPAPSITTQPTSVSVTVSNPATLTVEATDATAYQWYTCDKNGDTPIEITGETSNTLTITPDALGTIYYKVVASNTCGNTTSNIVSITATDGPCFEVTKNATTGSITKGTNVDASSYFNVTAGGKIAFTTSGSSREVTANGVKMDNDNDYFLITLPEGSAFAPNTKISFVVYSTSNNRGLTINGTAITSTYATDKLIKGSIILPAEFVTTDSIKIYRAGGTVYFQAITVEGCGKMCINPQLAWSAETVDGILGGTFSFPTLDNNTYNLLPITYASSDETVATISADGTTITPLKVGTTTISATYAGDEDYCAQTVSYTLHVRCAVAPKITLESGANAQCYETIVLRAVRSDDGNAYPTGSFQWYKDDVALTGETKVTFTTTETGTYTVAYIADGGCEEMSVNSAKVTSTVVKPVVEKKAPHRNYQIKNRTLRPYTSATHYPLFDVTPTPTDTYTGQTWQPSYTIHAAGTGKITAGTATIDWVRKDATKGTTITLGADYEKLGTWLSTNGFGEANVGDTLMLTMRAVNACNLPDDATADSIPIILTDKYSLAYIVRGDMVTRNFYDITAADITDPLYTNLSAQYNVTPVSAYANYNYANYEPYDLLLLTDYPNATGGEKQDTYIDALADLVDKKPILSLKAHMSALPKWSAKGFTSNPVVPGDGSEAQAQKTLTVLCFSHDMFAGADWDNADDRTLTILDNVYKDGSTYKGIQGFLAINSANFVNIAKVYDAKGNRNLVACCERQDVTEARFIMLSINRGATQYINEKGSEAIDKLLEYLLWTEAANVSDCSLTFDNGEGDCKDCSGGKREFTEGGKTYTSGDNLWSNPANWNAKAIPTQLQNVRIEANCIVSGNTYGAGNVRIKEGNTLTIAPDGGLASVGQFAYYSGNNWNVPLKITDTKYITVQADAVKTGMLMHSHTDQVAATVQMYSPAYYEGGVLTNGNERIWTYVAIPVQAGTVPQIFCGAYTYLWSEQDGWTRYKDGSTFHAFDGIALSQPSPQTFTFAGNLALAKEYKLTLTNGGSMGGMNLIGNSWTAPIQITKLEATDFGEGLEATVYIYSTGRDPDTGPATTSNGDLAAGYWTAIPVATAKTSGWTGPKIIPAMQAFEVNFATDATATSATLTLDYNTIVRASGVDYSTLNQKLYAPGRNSTAEILQPDPSAPAPYEPTMLRIRVADTAACYNLHLLQGERFSEGFDNGWDGFYTGTDGRAPGLCALTTAGEMQVSAQPEIDNTTLVFTPGKSNTYTFSFCLTETEDEPLAAPLYLNDMQLRKSCLIDDSRTYTFQSSENDMENRFVISHIAFEEQDTPTGITNLTTVDQQLMLSNPAREALTIRVYDPAGKLCSEQQTNAPLLQLNLPTTQGVYMLYITGEQTQILRKAIQ